MQPRASRHALTGSTSSVALPPRFTVPPSPPVVHRRLALHLHDDYLLITPVTEAQSSKTAEESLEDGEAWQVKGFTIGWGVKGKVEAWEGSIETDDEPLELGGILGLARLWDGMSPLLHLTTGSTSRSADSSQLHTS